MNVADDGGRRFWREQLLAGGATELPRWSLDPVPGHAEVAAAVDAEVLAGLRGLAAELAVPLPTLVLAAHARVLSALVGEPDVVVGHVVADGRALPCRLHTRAASWRELVTAVRTAESALQAAADVDVDELRRELDVVGPTTEAEFSPAGSAAEPGPGRVLRIAVDGSADGVVLRLTTRTEDLDAGAAGRCLGYHLAALEAMAADPGADPDAADLLTAEEVHQQVSGLAGPHRELPDRRAHELVRDQAATRPDEVAVVHGDRRWTYRELVDRADRLSRALLTRGLPREGVVAVVTERNLDWAAAVLAVLQAGGAYLPIEPHFPAGRIATVLSRAGCRLVLTEAASRTTLDEAAAGLPDVEVVDIGAAYKERHDEVRLPQPGTPDQLAYIYFTSGSTGEPKGAMCEHAGMLNHLLAKIGDLDIGPGRVVAQTAPQCFDISLWQLVAAWLVGGRTVIVPQEVVLDVQRFVDTVAEQRVDVLQVVPSYLDLVLAYLEQHPRPLPDLRYVSVTGEAVKRELVQRWFAGQPGIRLVNAYGLTETSDDTNHEVMDRVPDGDRVPLGRPVANVWLYVVDEDLRPVPLGAPGEIVFSGVCVGRGYVNDPERTARAFVPDPLRPGERLYRSGDHGRWRPDGKLEYLGRRDSQVKIAGFRIEIGEVENALLRVPGVRDAAVVVAERGDGSRQLVAFSTGEADIDLIAGRLAAGLPAYMVPTAFSRRDRLPLTANGKIDRKALAGEARELAAAPPSAAPTSPTEKRMAAAWAKVLGVPVDGIGRTDSFFERGGTSLSAVRLAITLDRQVSLKDITRTPVLADLAELLDDRTARTSELLQQLAEPGEAGTLVCFPPAGGNAVNFRPMAEALRGSGLGVLAVELPGHDLGAGREPFAAVARVVDQVVDELRRRTTGPLLLWGHSSGTALALAAARRLVAAGVEVRQLHLAAQLPGTAAGRRAAVAELGGRSDAELTAELAAEHGLTGTDALDRERADHLGAAYRHDLVAAHVWLAAALDAPPGAPLPVPVTVVVAADDPLTAGYRERFLDWSVLAGPVRLHELADGGHWFLRTRPGAAAAAVLTGSRLQPAP